MSCVGKRIKEARKNLEPGKLFPLNKAISNLSDFPKVKFDETVEMHLHLNIDPKKTDQMVRGTVVLPHGTGKAIRIAVFCKGENTAKAKELGVDFVGEKDLIDKVSKGFVDFDCVIATPDMMRDISKLGKILGPRGLMPTPKAGTVTNEIEKTVQDIKAGKIEFKSDKQGGLHIAIGKRSFSDDKLIENAEKLLDAINHTKPSAVKGALVKSLFLSTTMGPALKVSIL